VKVIKIVFLALFFLIVHGCKKQSEPENPKGNTAPNILFIAVDDLNTMLSSYGGPAKTPNFDRLAKMGVQFNDAHCQAPLCGPSRASVMTGLRPSTTGIYGMIPDDAIKSNDNPATKDVLLLPEYLKDHGYHTMGIGKLFHDHAPQNLFDESGGRVKGFGPYPKERFVWDGHGTSDRNRYGKTGTDWGAFPESDTLMPDHQSVNWAIERLNKKYETPFFMGVGFLRVHVPLYVPQKWFDLYPLDSIITMPYLINDLDDVPPVAHKINDLPMMPSTEWAIQTGEWTKIIQAYLACISYVDYELGRLLDSLEKSEHANNTIIVLWSDHGYRLGEKGTFAKHALWDVATKVPLFFAGPNIPRNKVLNEPVELLSIYPTLLELCGLPPNSKNEGKSLIPFFHETLLDPPIAVSTFGRNNHSIKSLDYRYIRYEDGGEELYDHTLDPNEFNNLVTNDAYKKVLMDLKKYLPKYNAHWDEKSNYTFQPYFVEQKARLNLMR
jgi:arylsulfatase A-like enzyme